MHPIQYTPQIPHPTLYTDSSRIPHNTQYLRIPYNTPTDPTSHTWTPRNTTRRRIQAPTQHFLSPILKILLNRVRTRMSSNLGNLLVTHSSILTFLQTCISSVSKSRKTHPASFIQFWIILLTTNAYLSVLILQNFGATMPPEHNDFFMNPTVSESEGTVIVTQKTRMSTMNN